MHAVYCALKHPDLAPLPVLCKFALLVAAIALHHASLGVSNAELRRRRHPLDLVYCGQTPQEMASASAAFTTAMSSTDANIFSNLTDADYERVNGEMSGIQQALMKECETCVRQHLCHWSDTNRSLDRCGCGKVWALSSVPHAKCPTPAGLVTNLITESSPEYESRLAQMSVIIKSKVHVANVSCLRRKSSVHFKRQQPRQHPHQLITW